MITRTQLLGLLATGCMTAAAGGAYVAVRQNAAEPVATSPAPIASPVDAAKPVSETEAVITPAAPASQPVEAVPTVEAPKRAVQPAPKAVDKDNDTRLRTTRRTPAPRVEPAVEPPVSSERPTAPREPASTSTAAGTPLPTIVPEPPGAPPPPPAPVTPQFVEVVVPASSVIGLQVENSISSETAQVEDRINARVTRDVIADGRVVIPAGSRMLGNVMLVERGGKMKDKARLGVRFHTLVLADSSEKSVRTESIFREGSSPGNESARKIGGAAVGGAILGAIIGGGKGAAIGGATGAAGGTAVVMAGDRNAATLPAGTIVTARVTSPVTFEVEKEP
jgi:hypothetical protein